MRSAKHVLVYLALVGVTEADDSLDEVGVYGAQIGHYLVERQDLALPLPDRANVFPPLAPGIEFPGDVGYAANISDLVLLAGMFEFVSQEVAFVELANGNYAVYADVRFRYNGTDPIDFSDVLVVFDITSQRGGSPRFLTQMVPADDPQGDFDLVRVINGGGTFDAAEPTMGFVVEDIVSGPADTFDDGPLRAYRYLDVGVLQPGDEFEETWIFDVGVPVECAPEPECFLVLGDGAGTTAYTPFSHTFWPQLNEVLDSYPVLLDDIPEFPLVQPEIGLPRTSVQPLSRTGSGPPPPFATTTVRHLAASGIPNPIVQEFWVQVLMWNPEVFPDEAEQWTNPLAVFVLEDGRIVTRPFGHGTGMQIWHETGVDEHGQPVIRFPFSIPGF